MKTGLLLAEDEALKVKLQGIKVTTDRRGGTEVPVRFRMSDPDVAPQGRDPRAPKGVVYPLITIDQLSVVYDPTRDHTAFGQQITYEPSTAVLSEIEEHVYTADFPLPVRLYYQITAFSMNWQHDREIFSQLLHREIVPLKVGTLYVPADETNRLMVSLGTTQSNTLSQNRRIFRRTHSVYVEAEILRSAINSVAEARTMILDPLTSDVPGMVGIA